MELVVLALVGLATALATGLGVLPVWWMGRRAATLTPAFEGAVAGIMVVAAVAGLLVPAIDEGRPGAVAAGLVVGVAFLLATRRLLARGERGRRLGAVGRRAWLVVAVLFVHSLPEGFAIGTAFASDRASLDVFIALAIGLQNVPEGTATAVPMAEAGAGRLRQLLTAIGTSLPQPVGAVVAYLLAEQVDALLAASFAFAAGAMLALVVVDVAPAAMGRGHRRAGALGVACGCATMLALTALLGPG